MAWQGVEIEIEVPCAEGRTHPVRLRFTGWGEFEVAYNPCEELLGPVFARMAACTHYLHEAFPEAFHDDTDLRRRLAEAFGAAGAPAVPALIQALEDLRLRLFAVRQRRRWAQSATPKPCPRSSKHWGIATVLFAVRQRRRWANSATPKPSPRLFKHCGMIGTMFAVRQRRRW
jgi:hypothetical protein